MSSTRTAWRFTLARGGLMERPASVAISSPTTPSPGSHDRPHQEREGEGQGRFPAPAAGSTPSRWTLRSPRSACRSASLRSRLASTSRNIDRWSGFPATRSITRRTGTTTSSTTGCTGSSRATARVRQLLATAARRAWRRRPRASACRHSGSRSATTGSPRRTSRAGAPTRRRRWHFTGCQEMAAAAQGMERGGTGRLAPRPSPCSASPPTRGGMRGAQHPQRDRPAGAPGHPAASTVRGTRGCSRPTRSSAGRAARRCSRADRIATITTTTGATITAGATSATTRTHLRTSSRGSLGAGELEKAEEVRPSIPVDSTRLSPPEQPGEEPLDAPTVTVAA